MQLTHFNAFLILMLGTQIINILPNTPRRPFSIGIIGATGYVGEHAAFLLQEREVADKLLLWGRNQKKCAGNVEDLGEVSNMDISKVDSIQEIAPSNVIVITAGEKNTPDQPDRDKLLQVNMKIIAFIFNQLASSPQLNSQAVILMVTNPVDDLTQYAINLCKQNGYLKNPEKQIIGTGTLLDQYRSSIVSKYKNLVVLGEHGENLFMAWSMDKEAHNLPDNQKEEIVQNTKRKGLSILVKRGFTRYGIGRCITEICDAIRNGGILPVSVWDSQHQVVISRPALLGPTGVQSIQELDLTREEVEKYNICVQKRKQNAIK